MGLPLYLAYAGSDSPTKRGLILHATTIGVGIAVGGIFSSHLSDGYASASPVPAKPSFAQVTGLGLMPVNGGMGLQMMGSLY